MNKLVKILLPLLSFFCVAQDANALPLQVNTLYMCDFQAKSKLYVLNSTNGAKTLVGSIGTQCTDLAFVGSKLNAVTFSKFLTINPVTGAITASKNHGFTDINALVAGSSGTLYAAGSINNGGKGANFVRINASTGVGTVIGKYGAGLTSAGDLEFLGGILYATVNKPGSATTWLAKINTSTGKATLVGNIGHQNVWGLAVRNGLMFAVSNNGKVLRINTANGVGVVIGTNGVVQAGLAKSP